MYQLLLNNKRVLFLIGSLGIVAVVLLIISIRSIQRPQNQEVPETSTSPSKQQIQTAINVINIDPPSSSVLKPGAKQNFYISFDNQTTLDQLNISVRFKDVRRDDASSSVSFRKSLTNNNTQLVLSLNSEIQPFGQYDIIISGPVGKRIFSTSYLSDLPKDTPIPTNNLHLKQYLPYETENYRLVYQGEKNIYIFNFKYNPSSSMKLQEQYEKAKNEAIKFIQSKGININSIVIEWRYS